MNTGSIRLGLLAALILLTGANRANASLYEFVDLGRLVTGPSDAYGINNSGQVAGYHSILGVSRATLWQGSTATELGLLDGPSSVAYGINNAGQVVGRADEEHYGVFVSSATMWNGTTATALPSGIYSIAYSINDAGQVAGASDELSGQAIVWNGNTITTLDLLGNSNYPQPFAQANAINMAGQVAGYNLQGYPEHPYRATLWNGTTATDLGMLGGPGSAAYGINNAGQVVGNADLPNAGYHEGFPNHAVLWQDGVATDLGTLGGTYSQANAINEAGLIVGFANLRNTGGYGVNEAVHAALWNGTTAVDLNDLLDDEIKNLGWVLTNARDINDNGWIVGQANNDITGVTHAFLLTPAGSIPSLPELVFTVSEPGTIALFISGLGLMGFMARRRKNS